MESVRSPAPTNSTNRPMIRIRSFEYRSRSIGKVPFAKPAKLVLEWFGLNGSVRRTLTERCQRSEKDQEFETLRLQEVLESFKTEIQPDLS